MHPIQVICLRNKAYDVLWKPTFVAKAKSRMEKREVNTLGVGPVVLEAEVCMEEKTREYVQDDNDQASSILEMWDRGVQPRKGTSPPTRKPVFLEQKTVREKRSHSFDVNKGILKIR